MAITASKKTLSIKDGQIDRSALAIISGSFNLGPLTINYTVDTSVPQVTFTVTLAGINIGGGTINAQNPSITIGGSALGFTAQLTLTANFDQSNVTYDGTLCAPFVGCTDFSGVLVSW